LSDQLISFSPAADSGIGNILIKTDGVFMNIFFNFVQSSFLYKRFIFIFSVFCSRSSSVFQAASFVLISCIKIFSPPLLGADFRKIFSSPELVIKALFQFFRISYPFCPGNLCTTFLSLNFSPALEKDFLKGFDPEEFPDLEARESSELFLVEILGLFGLSELLLSLLILKISAKIVI
jgi:hypothetical protein